MESLNAAVDDPVLYLFGLLARSPSMAPLEGMEPDAPVLFVESGDLACAASVVSLSGFKASIDASSPEHADVVARRAWRHHDVLSRLHQSATVLPLKFGTLCPDTSIVRGILDEQRDTIASLLDRFRGFDEWTLKITVDEGGIGSRFDRESPDLLRMQAAESAMSDGHAYFARRARLKKAADLVADAVGVIHDAVLDRLSGFGIELVRHGGGAALLVDRARFAAARDELSALEAMHADAGVSLELVGPWPPYSFVPALQLGRE